MATTQKKKKGQFEIGVNLRVTQCFDKGSRNYMEDFSRYYFEKDPTNNQSVVFAFFGVFDGHGGTEAAELAHRCLLEEIKSQEKFWSLNDDDVLDSIREGFLRTHQKMVDARSKWPLTPSGFQSTAGTTASIALIRNRKLYVGHVGDSAIVVGRCPPDSKDSATDNWTGNALTVEHKPDHPEERRRIEAHGGSVRRKAGIHRVVWNRPKPARLLEDTPPDTPEFEEIPFLAVARSLGDLWSFDADTGQFHVSPEPDCAVYDLRPHEHRCIIIGSDGLWNVIRPEAAVELVRLCERETEARVFADFGVAPNFFYHPAGTLVRFALERCSQRQVRSDNVTAVVVMVDPPGKPMTQLRQERRRLFFSRLGLDEPADGAAHQGLVRRLLVESQRAHGNSAGTAPVAAEAEEEREEEGGRAAAKVRLGSGATTLRQALMGSTGFPTLLSGWSDACWRAMNAYCSEAGLSASQLLEHLMDMDVKFRKEALLAVPAVVSLKRAFTYDWEMTVCLSQLPLLAPEWTQLLVLCGASPPTSPSSSSTPSPSRRWIERRERILGVLYALLEQRPMSGLSKEARGLMRAHTVREEKARARAVPLLAPELAAVIKDEPEPLSPAKRTRAQRAAMNGRPALRRGAPASPDRLSGSPRKQPAKADVPPAKSDVQPTKANGQPTKANVQPTKANVPPAKSNVPPAKSNVPPAKSNAQPARASIQSPQNAKKKPSEEPSSDAADMPRTRSSTSPAKAPEKSKKHLDRQNSKPADLSPRSSRLRSRSPASAPTSGSPRSKAKSDAPSPSDEQSPLSQIAADQLGKIKAGTTPIVTSPVEPAIVGQNLKITSFVSQIFKKTPLVGRFHQLPTVPSVARVSVSPKSNATSSVEPHSNTTPSVGRVSVTVTPTFMAAKTNSVAQLSNPTPSPGRLSVTPPVGPNSKSTSLTCRTNGPSADQNVQPALPQASPLAIVPSAQSDSSSPPLLTPRPFEQASRARKRPHWPGQVSSGTDEQDKVDTMMRKLVVTFTPDPSQLKNFERHPSTLPKLMVLPQPKLLKLPSVEEKKKKIEMKKDEERKKKEKEREKKDEQKKEALEKLSVSKITDQMNCRSFAKRLIVDASAEARLEEMMRSIVSRSAEVRHPDPRTEPTEEKEPTEVKAPTEVKEASEPKAMPVVHEQKEEGSSPKRRRLQSEEVPRRRLRVRTTRTDV